MIIWFIVYSLRTTEKIIPLAAKIRGELYKNNDLKKLNSYFDWITARSQIINQYGPDKILDFQKQNLLQFKKLYKNPLFFIYGDWIKDYEKKVFDDFLKENYKKYWSLTISIPEENKFPNDDHPNKKGYKQIAEDIFNFLIKNKVIPCEN